MSYSFEYLEIDKCFDIPVDQNFKNLSLLKNITSEFLFPSKNYRIIRSKKIPHRCPLQNEVATNACSDAFFHPCSYNVVHTTACKLQISWSDSYLWGKYQ